MIFLYYNSFARNTYVVVYTYSFEQERQRHGPKSGLITDRAFAGFSQHGGVLKLLSGGGGGGAPTLVFLHRNVSIFYKRGTGIPKYMTYLSDKR